MFQKDDWKIGIIATVFGSLLLYFSSTSELTENVLAMSDVAGPFGVPKIIAVIIIFIGLIHILTAFLLRKDTSSYGEKKKEEEAGEILAGMGCDSGNNNFRCLYFLLLSFLGYLISNSLLIAVLMYLFHERNWKKIILFSVLFTGALFLVFNSLLNVDLPTLFVLN